MRSTIRGALDVEAPAFGFEAIRERAARRLRARRERAVRLRGALMLAFALTALAAGTYGRSDQIQLVAASPMPAPEPQPT
ncbi:MAG: hypothetical protein KGN02_14655 [bacterium]|nr:hypothetical protein [bacterium]